MGTFKDMVLDTRQGNAGGLILPLSANVLLRGGQSVSGTKGIRKSLDNGQTWTLKHTYSTSSWDTRLSFIDSRGNIFFGTISTTVEGVIHRSTDQGETWAEVATSEGSGWWTMAEDAAGNLYASEYSSGSQDANELYAYNIWKSTDGGATWSKFHTATQQSSPGAQDGTRHVHHITHTPDGKLLAGWGDVPVFSGLAGKAHILNADGTLGTLVDTTANGFTGRVATDSGILFFGGDASPIKIYRYNPSTESVTAVLDLTTEFGAQYSSAILDMVKGSDGVLYAITNGATGIPSVIIVSGDDGITWRLMRYTNDTIGASFLNVGHGKIYIGRAQSGGANTMNIPDYTRGEIMNKRRAIR